MLFYLGTHQVSWLSSVDVPLFVSRRRLAPRRTLPRARHRWALDSGGFKELELYGGWTVTAATYAAEVRRFAADIGKLDWAAPQDWMCEPQILARTGLTVREHQRRTIDNFLELRSLAPEMPWTPVLQGWTLGDYLNHVEAYQRAGVDLFAEPVVGLGSVCRRQLTMRASIIITHLADDGLKLHGFGFKTTGLRASAKNMVSADSLAWSINARKNQPLPECTHKSCSSCKDFAIAWRAELLDSLVA